METVTTKPTDNLTKYILLSFDSIDKLKTQFFYCRKLFKIETTEYIVLKKKEHLVNRRR